MLSLLRQSFYLFNAYFHSAVKIRPVFISKPENLRMNFDSFSFRPYSVFLGIIVKGRIESHVQLSRKRAFILLYFSDESVWVLLLNSICNRVSISLETSPSTVTYDNCMTAFLRITNVLNSP